VAESSEESDEVAALSEPEEHPGDAHPKSRFARQIRKALLLARAGQVERANELIESLLSLEPDNIPVREALVRLKLDTGKTEEAAQLADKLLSDDPGNPYALCVHGSMAVVRGDYKDAEAKLMESVKKHPLPESLNNLAWLLNETGRHEEAEPYARQAVDMDPTVQHAWNTLGLVLLKRKRFDDAGNAFKKALKLADDDICANLNMAEIHLRQGRLRPARKLLRRLETRQNEMLASERKHFRSLETAAMKS
jgi:Flp pilus assembly protein TadD